MAKSVPQKIKSLVSQAEQELTVLDTLHPQVESAMLRLEERDPGLRQVLDSAYGYAVFPNVGKAALVVGGAFGKGEVFERGKQIGYAGLVQLTLGVQLGGDTFTEFLVFRNKAALERFKAGRVRFAANASAVLVKAGAAASADHEAGVTVYVYAQGGMLLETAIGGQKFFFRPSALGRGKRPTPPRRKPRRAPARHAGRAKSRSAERKRAPTPAARRRSNRK